MTIQSFHPPVRTLMGPGPSDVSPRVLGALARPTLGHLDPAFVGMMDEVKTLLQYAFQTKNELTMPISAPGSAGMEAVFVNLVEPGDSRAGRLLGKVRIGLALAAALACHGREPAREILPQRGRKRVLRIRHGREFGLAKARCLGTHVAEPARLRRSIGNARVERPLGKLA